MKFQELMDFATAEREKRLIEMKEAQKRVEDTKNEWVEAGCDLMRLKAIQDMAGWSQPCWEWNTEGIEQGSAWSHEAWRQAWHMWLVEHDFTIVLHERTDLKKWKYVVKVYGKNWLMGHTSTHDQRWHHSQYLESKYGKDTCEKKFTTEEAARGYVDQMLKQIEADHITDIVAQKKLATQITEEQKIS